MATLDNVLNDQPIEFSAYETKGVHSRPVGWLPDIEIEGDLSKAFTNFLALSSWGGILETELQGLCTKSDGTELLTTVLPVKMFHQMMDEAGEPFRAIAKEAHFWCSDIHCNQVMIHFQKPSRA